MFPFAFAINSFSMTILFISFGLLGLSALAADVAVVQGATLALFFAFSANARNLILNSDSAISTSSLLLSRVALILPLGCASFILSAGFTKINTFLALVLIIRKCAEWISELHLSYLEFNNRKPFAKTFILIQLALLLLAIFWKLHAKTYSDFGILLWAIVPLAIDGKFIISHFKLTKIPPAIYAQLLPHFGSTAMTGITVYIFRLFLIILLGKELTGDLVTAFATGGLLSSVFNTALGPSLAFKQNQIRPILHGLFKSFLSLYCMLGLLILILAPKLPEILIFIGKSGMFWAALGSSMIGGGIMTLSLKIRIALLQHNGKKDVFGQDLVINLLILTFTLSSYYIFGDYICKYLFLFNATISFVVYSASQLSLFSKAPFLNRKIILISLCGLLVFPLFFQLSGHIFSEPIQNFDSQGKLFLLPIPASVVICFCGILLVGSYENSKASLYVIFFSFITMLVAILAAKQGGLISNPLDKIILMIQFIIPMFGMVFGQMFFKTQENLKLFSQTTFIIIAFLIPAQLVATYLAKTPYLSTYLYLFSIYQHLQYVPTIFIALYFIALFTLWEDARFKRLHFVLSPFVGIYSMLSISLVTLALLCTGLIAFVCIKTYRGNGRMPIFLASVIMVSLIFTQGIIKNTDPYMQKFVFVSYSIANQNKTDQPAKNPPAPTQKHQSNISARSQIWGFYLKGILDNPYNFVFGNADRPPRAQYHSAHNYYLDLIYNFGFLALTPIGVLLVATLYLIFRNKKAVICHPEILGLVFITIFLLLGDNLVKVSLRQPYPGIITFFLWGLLISSLIRKKKVL